MGMKANSPELSPRTSLAAALFTNTQQRVLALLFGQPGRSFFATEIIGLAGAGSGAVQRELVRLAQSGLLTVSRIGTQKHYQANPQAPIYDELCAIVQKTVGLAEPLREALAPLAERIATAFVFGSVAGGEDTATSDIDLLVLARDIDYADVFAALQAAEEKLGRTVNPSVYTPGDWRRKRKQGNAFVTKVTARPKLFVIGSEADLD